MLTKADLSQIRKVVREEVEAESKVLKDELQSDITMLRIRLQGSLDELANRVKNVEIRITKLEESVKKMHKDLKAEIKLVTHFLDNENVKTVKRVKRIELHLGLQSDTF